MNSAVPAISSAALIREKDAEIEYLRSRNLQLSAAIDHLSAQIAESQTAAAGDSVAVLPDID